MAVQPWYVGDTFPAIPISLNIDGGADNITGLTTSNFKMIIRNLGVTPNTDTVGTGTFAITGANPATITYQFSDADTRIATNAALVIEATFPAGGGSLSGTAIWDPIPFPFTPV